MARTYLNTVIVCVPMTIKFVGSFAAIHGTLGSRGESQLQHALCATCTSCSRDLDQLASSILAQSMVLSFALHNGALFPLGDG